MENEIVTNGQPQPAPVISPERPILSAPVPDVKIQMDYPEQESDVRSEPVHVKGPDAIEDASTVARLGTPPNPDSIPVSPPLETPLEAHRELGDVEMGGDEGQMPQNGIQHADVAPAQNGHPQPQYEQQQHVQQREQSPPPPPVQEESRPQPYQMQEAHRREEEPRQEDVTMEEKHQLGYASPDARDMAVDTPGRPSLPPASAHTSAAHSPEDANGDEQNGPPAKRARVHSDPDRASMAHSASPPPESADTTYTNGTTPVAPLSRQQSYQPQPAPSAVGFTPNQFRFAISALRTVKKHRDAAAFLMPVDPIALGIPHYPQIIVSPMDLGTVERKLNASNPNKTDGNPRNPRYRTAQEFSDDVHLTFGNSVTFNGPDHLISQAGMRAQDLFDKTMKGWPAAIDEKPNVAKRYTPPAPVARKAAPPVRRPSASNPSMRRSDHEAIGRPKRETHPPAPRDMPYESAPKSGRPNRRIRDEINQEQLRFCGKVLTDLGRKKHAHIASAFYYPVDLAAVPDYPRIVKNPIDLATMKDKLEANQYQTARHFWDDFKLMIRNCFLFNPAGSPVNQAGIELQRLFDEKWKSLPSMDESDYENDDDDVEDGGLSEVDRLRAIADYEDQIVDLRTRINSLKAQKPRPPPPKPQLKREKYVPAPVASTSKPPPRPPKQAPPPKAKKVKKQPVPEDDTLSFEQKKDLSEAISGLDGPKLERVIQIIHEGVPEIRDSTEEIELEIDLLPSAVLTKLYNFVLRPLKTTTKRSRVVKGTGTGGLKRKSMDEEVEAEKIRQLEERMALFDSGAGGASASGGAPAPGGGGEEHSSDSSSNSDSSGSDSE